MFFIRNTLKSLQWTGVIVYSRLTVATVGTVYHLNIIPKLTSASFEFWLVPKKSLITCIFTVKARHIPKSHVSHSYILLMIFRRVVVTVLFCSQQLSTTRWSSCNFQPDRRLCSYAPIFKLTVWVGLPFAIQRITI